jgi:hypothetical protein
MVLMSATVGMDVRLAGIVLGAVIVHAEVTFSQAMGYGAIVRKESWSGPIASRVVITQSVGNP